MDLATKINIGICMASFILAVVSVVTVLITIRQNNRMIECSTRPYICVYGQLVNLGDIQFYIVAKNFGASPATITKFETEPDLSDCHLQTQPPRIHLEGVVNTTIAPGQSRICLLDFFKVPNKVIQFHIEYTSGKKKYSESFSSNIKAGTDMLKSKYGSDNADPDLHAISYTLQEILQRDL